MNKENYPTWHIPLNIVKELKAIGFDKISVISYSAGTGITAIRKELYSWEQVFEWFREKGFNGWIEYQTLYEKYIPKLAVREEFIYIKKNRGYKTYEKAREALVKALIQTYKSKQL